jgi:1,4-dihydroxy-2-naphthoate polyprenyltransferase
MKEVGHRHRGRRGKFTAFLVLTRPIFLLGGVVMYGLGTVLAVHEGADLNWGRAVLGQLMVTAIQLVAQYANEHFDLAADRLNAEHRTWFSGGSGVLASGRLGGRVAYRAALVCAGISVALIVTLGVQVPLSALIGALALFGAWFYSAPPLALMSSGWGEVLASVVVTVLTPLAGHTAQTGSLSPRVVLAALPLFLLHVAMMVVFNIADRVADDQAGKRTLVVRWGVRRSVLMHACLVLGAFVLLSVLPLSFSTEWLWLGLPLAAYQQISITRKAQAKQNRWQTPVLGAIALFAGSAALMLLAALTA